MELKTQVKALNYTKKLLMGETDSILPWQAYPQKPIFRQGHQAVPLMQAAPEQEGVSSAYLQAFLQSLSEISTAKVHCCVAVRNRKQILSADFFPYTAQMWHISHSLCKTIVGMAIGILCDSGQLSTETPLSEIFPEYFNLFTSRKTRSLTVWHLLTMSSGINFREMGALLEKDWLRSYFEADVVFEPSTRFDYNSMNTYVLGRIVQRIAHTSLTEFLKEHLFEPLGFGAYEWETCPMGHEKGGWGLYLMPQDMAKLGVLLLEGGVWKKSDGTETRILSQEWINQMTTTQMQGQQGSYGLQLWTLPNGDFAMNGMYGQYVYCVPKNNLAVVVCSGANNLFAESKVLNLLSKTFSETEFPATLPPSAEEFSALTEVAASLRFGEAFCPTPKPIEEPWYRQWLQKIPLFAPVSLPQEPSGNEKMAEFLKGKHFAPPKNNVGMLPLFVQCMQGNYTKGVSGISFENNENGFLMVWQEGADRLEIPMNFGKYTPFEFIVGNERWKAAVFPQAKTNEDDVPVLKVTVCFLEHSAVREIKIFFYPESTVLRVEETPSIGESLLQMRGNPQADLVIELFKDAGYAKYRFDRFCSPELVLTETNK